MLTRRHILLGLAMPLAPGAALAKEPFPVFRSEVNEVAYRFRRRDVTFETKLPAGTIFVDIRKRYLYLIEGGNKAVRYGVGIGREAMVWEGEAVIGRKAKWPSWRPSPELVAEYKDRDPDATWLDGVPGGPDNPLGARALYLFQGGNDTLFRIHGTNQPKTIGTASSRGCLRMVNVDVIELYDRAPVGTRVIVSRTGKPVA